MTNKLIIIYKNFILLITKINFYINQWFQHYFMPLSENWFYSRTQILLKGNENTILIIFIWLNKIIRLKLYDVII